MMKRTTRLAWACAPAGLLLIASATEGANLGNDANIEDRVQQSSETAQKQREEFPRQFRRKRKLTQIKRICYYNSVTFRMYAIVQ